MNASSACIKLVKVFEGLAKLRPDGKVEAYLCPAKVPTIGCGSTGADIKLGVVWTVAECETRFTRDLNRFAANVSAVVGDAPTTQGEFDAFVAFAYNVGLGAFSRSTLLALHKLGKRKEAAAQFARWNKAAGKPVAGLTRRRDAEADLYRSS